MFFNVCTHFFDSCYIFSNDLRLLHRPERPQRIYWKLFRFFTNLDIAKNVFLLYLRIRLISLTYSRTISGWEKGKKGLRVFSESFLEFLRTLIWRRKVVYRICAFFENWYVLLNDLIVITRHKKTSHIYRKMGFYCSHTFLRYRDVSSNGLSGWIWRNFFRLFRNSDNAKKGFYFTYEIFWWLWFISECFERGKSTEKASEYFLKFVWIRWTYLSWKMFFFIYNLSC